MDTKLAPPADPAAERKRIIRGRNIALGLVLAGFAALFFFITIAKLSA
jgi:hypothetical protein